MSSYVVLRRDWIGRNGWDVAVMVPIMTLTAKSAVDALRIAKQKNVVCPIIHKGVWKC